MPDAVLEDSADNGEAALFSGKVWWIAQAGAGDNNWRLSSRDLSTGTVARIETGRLDGLMAGSQAILWRSWEQLVARVHGAKTDGTAWQSPQGAPVFSTVVSDGATFVYSQPTDEGGQGLYAWRPGWAAPLVLGEKSFAGYVDGLSGNLVVWHEGERTMVADLSTGAKAQLPWDARLSDGVLWISADKARTPGAHTVPVTDLGPLGTG